MFSSNHFSQNRNVFIPAGYITREYRPEWEYYPGHLTKASTLATTLRYLLIERVEIFLPEVTPESFICVLQKSWNICLWWLLFLGKLSLNMRGELVQVFVHTLHAESLGVEKAAARSNTYCDVAQTAVGSQDKEPLSVWTERIFGHKTLFQQDNSPGIGWLLSVVCEWCR